MSELDTLIFPNAAGFAAGPIIDGFFDLDYMLTGETPEGGFIGGSQLTIGGSGIAPVVFRGVRNSSTGRIVMGFLCRFSGSWENNNAVVIIVKPSHSATPDQFRKIVINPILVGTGVAPGTGSGANEIETVLNMQDITTQVDYFKSDAGGVWSESQSFKPTGIEIAARSWKPSVASGASDEFAWSVEVSLPASPEAGDSNWITLANDFGLYFSVIKIVPVGGGAAVQYKFPQAANDVSSFVSSFTPNIFGHALVPAIAGPALPDISQGVGFSSGWQGIGRRQLGSMSTTLTHDIHTLSKPAGTDNEIVALLQNTGTNPANDITVNFRFANWGLPPADFTMWHEPGGLEPNPAPRRNGPSPQAAVNVAAGATNVAIAIPWTRANVPAIYDGKHLCMWAQLDALTPVNFTKSSMVRNMNFVNLSEHEQEAEVSGVGYDEPPNGSADHDFILQTFCRKIVIQELIDAGTSSLDPELGGMLVSSLQLADVMPDRNSDTRAATVGARATRGQSQFKDSVVYVWVTEGYRLTKHTITIGKTTYPCLDGGCGSFGFVAHHSGVKDNFGWTFSGPGMVRYAPGVYGLKVPHKGAVQIKTRLVAEPGGPIGDEKADLPKGDTSIFDVRNPDGPNSGGDPGGGKNDKPGGCFGLVLALAMIPGLGLATYLTS
jgi:hypothetical protein